MNACLPIHSVPASTHRRDEQAWIFRGWRISTTAMLQRCYDFHCVVKFKIIFWQATSLCFQYWMHVYRDGRCLPIIYLETDPLLLWSVYYPKSTDHCILWDHTMSLWPGTLKDLWYHAIGPASIYYWLVSELVDIWGHLRKPAIGRSFH